MVRSLFACFQCTTVRYVPDMGGRSLNFRYSQKQNVYLNHFFREIVAEKMNCRVLVFTMYAKYLKRGGEFIKVK